MSLPAIATTLLFTFRSRLFFSDMTHITSSWNVISIEHAARTAFIQFSWKHVIVLFLQIFNTQLNYILFIISGPRLSLTIIQPWYSHKKILIEKKIVYFRNDRRSVSATAVETIWKSTLACLNRLKFSFEKFPEQRHFER